MARIDSKKILFLLPYPLHCAPSQRFRVENFLPLLDEANISYKVSPFMTFETWKILYNSDSVFKKTWGVLKSFAARFKTIVFEAPKYSCIFIHREASPIGPPIFEWYLAKVLKKRIIYDFDDAIWQSASSSANPQAALIKCSWKVKYICKYSKIVTVGNRYLANYVTKYKFIVCEILLCCQESLYHFIKVAGLFLENSFK